MFFVIHWQESAMVLHVFPIPIPPPTFLWSNLKWRESDGLAVSELEKTRSRCSLGHEFGFILRIWKRIKIAYKYWPCEHTVINNLKIVLVLYWHYSENFIFTNWFNSHQNSMLTPSQFSDKEIDRGKLNSLLVALQPLNTIWGLKPMHSNPKPDH